MDKYASSLKYERKIRRQSKEYVDTEMALYSFLDKHVDEISSHAYKAIEDAAMYIHILNNVNWSLYFCYTDGVLLTDLVRQSFCHKCPESKNENGEPKSCGYDYDAPCPYDLFDSMNDLIND